MRLVQSMCGLLTRGFFCTAIWKIFPIISVYLLFVSYYYENPIETQDKVALIFVWTSKRRHESFIVADIKSTGDITIISHKTLYLKPFFITLYGVER